MTSSEYSAIIGVALLTGVLTFWVWRRHGIAGVRRVAPGFVVAWLAIGVGLIAGRLLGPEWTVLVMLILGLGLLGLGRRFAPRYFDPSPVTAESLKIQRPRLVALGVGAAVAIFLFALPGAASADPVNIGLAVLLGIVAAASFYWAATRVRRT